MATQLDKPIFPLQAIAQRFTAEYPERKQALDDLGPEGLFWLLGTARAIEQEAPAEEIIRIMRVYVFEGPRAKVEKQLARSLGEGTRIVGTNGGLKIHVATIGSIAEKLSVQSSEMIQQLGGQRVFIAPEQYGNVTKIYQEATTAGATLIFLPEGSTSPESERTGGSLYTLAKFRRVFAGMLKIDPTVQAEPRTDLSETYDAAQTGSEPSK